MNLRPAATLSDLLRAVLLPIAMWGMLAALLLELIELRDLLIAGGEARLRLATLAFALGVVLIQRLQAEQGQVAAGKYGIALGLSMLLFSIVDTATWTLPWTVLLANIALLGILWWAGHTITAACAVDEGTARAGAERGIFSRSYAARVVQLGQEEGANKPRISTQGMNEAEARIALFEMAAGENFGDPLEENSAEAAPVAASDLPSADARSVYDDFRQTQKAARAERATQRSVKKEKLAAGEKGWGGRLAGRHPGRVLLWFALVAVPVFGFAGVAGGSHVVEARTGIFLFVYLWSALTLLWLSSLGQLRAHFARRDAMLPEVVGMSWIAMGTAATTLALTAAFLLPRPPSPSGDFVHRRMVAIYSGWQSERGIRDSAPGGANKDGGDASGGRQGGKAADGGREQNAGGRDSAKPAPQADADSAAQNDTPFDAALHKFFSIFLLVLASIMGLVVLGILIAAIAYGYREFLASFRRARALRAPRAKKPEKKPGVKKGTESRSRFAVYPDPFAGDDAAGDGEWLVQALWGATLAYCADRGVEPAEADTPREFVANAPAPLAGFEPEAHWLAELLGYSEFSGHPFPRDVRPQLQDYWRSLRARSHL